MRLLAITAEEVGDGWFPAPVPLIVWEGVPPRWEWTYSIKKAFDGCRPTLQRLCIRTSHASRAS